MKSTDGIRQAFFPLPRNLPNQLVDGLVFDWGQNLAASYAVLSSSVPPPMERALGIAFGMRL